MAKAPTVAPTVTGHLKAAGALVETQAKAHWNTANQAIKDKGLFAAAGHGAQKLGEHAQAAWKSKPLAFTAAVIAGTVVAGHVACTAIKGKHERRYEQQRGASQDLTR